jgi:hypothetical protein
MRCYNLRVFGPFLATSSVYRFRRITGPHSSRRWLKQYGFGNIFLRTRSLSYDSEPWIVPGFEDEFEDDEEESSDSTTKYRPWTFNLPTIEEMQEQDWPDKVADWRMFWIMFEQWMYIRRALTRKKPKKFSSDYLAWLGLEYEDPTELLVKVITVWPHLCSSPVIARPPQWRLRSWGLFTYFINISKTVQCSDGVCAGSGKCEAKASRTEGSLGPIPSGVDARGPWGSCSSPVAC